MLLNLALWLGGAALLALGVSRARVPYARLRALRAADENARRYENWRGARRGFEPTGITGADVLRETMRRRVMTWAAIAGAGVVLIVVGFAVR